MLSLLMVYKTPPVQGDFFVYRTILVLSIPGALPVKVCDTIYDRPAGQGWRCVLIPSIPFYKTTLSADGADCVSVSSA